MLLLGVCGLSVALSIKSPVIAWLGGISTGTAIVLFIWALSVRNNIIAASPSAPDITISGSMIDQRPNGETFTNGILIESKEYVFTIRKDGHDAQYSCQPNEPNDDGTCYPRGEK